MCHLEERISGVTTLVRMEVLVDDMCNDVKFESSRALDISACTVWYSMLLIIDFVENM
jgi:hypothetical protein